MTKALMLLIFGLSTHAFSQIRVGNGTGYSSLYYVYVQGDSISRETAMCMSLASWSQQCRFGVSPLCSAIASISTASLSTVICVDYRHN